MNTTVPGLTFVPTDVGTMAVPDADRDAIRALDIEWAHRRMKKISGQPFTTCVSSVNGKLYSGNATALNVLHMLRAKVGNRGERRASKEFLRSEGLVRGVWTMGMSDDIPM